MNNLQKFLVSIVLASVLSVANANLISTSHNIQASGPGSLGYTLFEVSAPDTVSLFTTGNSIDPVLFLFRWDGHLDAGDMIAFNDDCTGCGASGGWNNAGITQLLAAGTYMAVVGDFALSLNDALLGLGNTGNTAFGVKTGNVGLSLSAQTAVLTQARVAAQVAEPGTLLLLGIALLLWPALRRRRH